jgi:5-methylcytosine-specific restriction endonuclease McrA
VSTNNRTSNGNLYRKNRAWLKAQGLPCALCGRPIDYTLGYRDPWAFEVDHIDPCAKGGALYDRANLQPAHRSCNQQKSDKRKASRKLTKPAKRVQPATSREW